MNKNDAGTIDHNGYKDILVVNQCLKHLMNRSQSKNHRTGNYEINEIFLLCLDGQMHILNYRYFGLALG